MEEMRKRKIIFNFDSMKMTLDTSYISDEACEKMVKKHATAYNISTKQAFVYDLGTEEQEENGTLFFCPKCGHYNEFGWDPTVNMFYKRSKEGGNMEPAGYYKYVPVDCDDCGTFEVNCKEFENQMKEMNKEFSTNETR